MITFRPHLPDMSPRDFFLFRHLIPHPTVDKNKVRSEVAFLPHINKITDRVGKIL